MRCPVTSGPFQCDRDVGHVGEHECTAPDSAENGPASDHARSSLPLRRVLDTCEGRRLDDLGAPLFVKRLNGESDESFRKRIWAAR